MSYFSKFSLCFVQTHGMMHNIHFSNGIYSFYPHSIKADLLVRYGGVAPKMAEEAHSLVIDQVLTCYLGAAFYLFTRPLWGISSKMCLYIGCSFCTGSARGS